MITLTLIAFSLSLDCFAVSLTGGALNKKPDIRKGIKLASYFGLFQAIMPLIGWFLGQGFSRILSNYDHWVAFVLLAGIGIKMIYESFKKCPKKKTDVCRYPTILLLSVATSIDALVVGISLGLLNTNVLISVAVIGIFAFGLTMAGYQIGAKLGPLFGNKVEILGGLILIGIGIKILVENLV